MKWPGLVLMLLLVGSGFTADRPWDQKPWTEWDRDTLRTIRKHSQWIRDEVPRDLKWLALVTWRSAKIMKNANERWSQLEEPVPGEEVVRGMSDQFFILGCQIVPLSLLSGPRPKVVEERDALKFRAWLEEAIAQSGIKRATLTLGATSLAASGYRMVDDKIFSCLIFFPRRDAGGEPTLPSGAAKVRFVVQFPAGIRIDEVFDLKKMLYEGEVDL
jgi:hypothetical protein